MVGQCVPAFFYYVVPRLANRQVLSHKLGCFFLDLEFCGSAPGWCWLLPVSASRSSGGVSVVVDAFVVLAFILMVFEFVLPFLKLALRLYVSAWYIIGGSSSRCSRTQSAISCQNLFLAREVQRSVAFGFTTP